MGVDKSIVGLFLLNKEDKMTHSEKMLMAISDGDLVEAQLAFEEALKHDEPDMLMALAGQLMGAGFLEEAEQVLLKLHHEFPTEGSILISLAEIAIENDQTDQAFEYLEAINKTDDYYVDSLLVLADLYQVLGVPEVSEKKIKEAKAILPDEPVLTLALAELYFTMDRFQEAVTLYKQLIVSELPEGVSVNDRLGAALSMLGEFEEALPYLEEANQEEQTDHRLFQLAITYIQVKDNEKAIQLLEQLKVLNPTYEGVYLPLASCLLDEGRHPEAEAVIAEGLSQNPYSLDLYHLASDNAFRLGKVAEAEEYLRKAIALEEDKEISLIKLGNLLLSDERFEEVLDTLSELANSSQGQVYWTMAQAHVGLEQFTEAATLYEQAFVGLKDDPEFLKDFGLFLRDEGQMARAEELLGLYLEFEPEDFDIQDLLTN